jgi:hypothetical protein
MKTEAKTRGKKFFIEMALANFGVPQGDQIGRFFASWVIIYFGEFYEKDIPVLVTYFNSNSYVLILTKKWLGLLFG